MAIRDLKKDVKSFLSEELANVGASGMEAAPITGASRLDIGVKARQRAKIKPMPDIELGKALLRKQEARKRKSRGGRASTILSEGSDTLG